MRVDERGITLFDVGDRVRHTFRLNPGVVLAVWSKSVWVLFDNNDRPYTYQSKNLEIVNED